MLRLRGSSRVDWKPDRLCRSPNTTIVIQNLTEDREPTSPSMCVVCERRGPFYSLWRSVPAIFIHGNMPNRHQEDKISLPAKNLLETPPGGVGQPPFAASGHRLCLGCFLVGPDVRWSVPELGWSVWSSLWASFACVTHDAIVCDFVCVFVVFSSYSGLVLLKT